MTKRHDDGVTDAGPPPPLPEPEHVSDDPGRPDTTILGAPGAMLVIISGPSGVGKDTIIDEMRRREAEAGRDGDRHYVVTMTTRAPRDGEVDGIDYNFVTRQEFLRIRADRGFLEANELYGNWYGSPRQQVRDALFAGKDVILKIDVQGAQIVKEQVTESLLIFIIPPIARDADLAAASARDRNRRRARRAPAERGDRARPAGRLRPRGRQRDRQGRTDRRSHRIDHRGRAGGTRGPAGPRLAPDVTLGLAPGHETADPARSSGRGASRRGGGRCRGRRRRATVHLRGAPVPCTTSRPARPCWSSSDGGRRSG